MRAILILAAILLAQPAHAQDGYEALEGLFGSATDPATSCSANPHALAIIDNRPHLARTWTRPRPDGGALREVYDLEGSEGTGFLLRQEGPYRPDPEGQGPYWILQLTQNPAGYCWRRPGWPMVRCEDQQLRCDSATS